MNSTRTSGRASNIRTSILCYLDGGGVKCVLARRRSSLSASASRHALKVRQWVSLDWLAGNLTRYRKFRQSGLKRDEIHPFLRDPCAGAIGYPTRNPQPNSTVLSGGL